MTYECIEFRLENGIAALALAPSFPRRREPMLNLTSTQRMDSRLRGNDGACVPAHAAMTEAG
jgi:hypothetical protein